MSVNPSHLRPGNWIHCKGSSHYGIVTGEILAKMERDEKFREKFEGIEITPDLLKAAKFTKAKFEDDIEGYELKMRNGICNYSFKAFEPYEFGVALFYEDNRMIGQNFPFIHQLQNSYFLLTGWELALPESAKIIPQKAIHES